MAQAAESAGRHTKFDCIDRTTARSRREVECRGTACSRRNWPPAVPLQLAAAGVLMLLAPLLLANSQEQTLCYNLKWTTPAGKELRKSFNAITSFPATHRR